MMGGRRAQCIAPLREILLYYQKAARREARGITEDERP